MQKQCSAGTYARQANAGIYARLSIDDTRNRARKKNNTADESISIINQCDVLSDHIRKMGWHERKVYIDDGYSGADFDRPAFKEMMEDVKNGVINLILVKDLSRLGRNYIEVGRYVDFILPNLGCRLVALSDGIDTMRDDNDMMHFRSLLNDYYLKDIGRKIVASHRVMAQEGKRVSGRPPYGYKVDPANNHKFLIDDFAANVVRRIYKMRLGGMSYGKIAGTLNDEGLLSPREYEYSCLGKVPPFKRRSVWLGGSLKRMLRNECYIGNRVQLKTKPLSHRIKKSVRTAPDVWVRADNVHEGIVSAEIWDAVQEIDRIAAEKYHYIPKRESLFKGKLRCADCGSSLANAASAHKCVDGHFTHYSKYQCAQYAQTGTKSCSNHIINEKVLKQLVLEDIQRMAAEISFDREAVITKVTAMFKGGTGGSQMDSVKRLKALKATIFELERKISKLYEDKVAGTVSTESFAMLIQRYEEERSKAQAEQFALLEVQVKSETQAADAAYWTELIDKHRTVTDIDRQLLDELVEKIEVGKVDVANGEKRQNIRIFYKLVGAVG